MRTLSEQGYALIMRHEGFSPIPYICPAGLSTIGYGHVILEGEAFPKAGISPEMAKNLLKQDVRRVEWAVNRFVAVEMSQNQFDALVSFAYNIGNKAFERSTLLRCLNQGLYEKVPKELGKWVFSRGKRLSGLVKRRAEEAKLFSTKREFTEL